MSDSNGQSAPIQTDDLDDLEKRLERVREKHAPASNQGADTSMLGVAWRISTELVVAVLVGCGLGLGVDTLTNTRPLFMIVGLCVGIAAGLRNVFRMVREIERKELERLAALEKSGSEE